MGRNADSLVQRIWYGDSLLRLPLLPFAWIYSVLIACRRFLYTSGLLRTLKLPVPVLIIGNITVGGTGKTPMTIWLAQQLAARGFRPGIVSRGYRGKVGPKPLQVTADSDPATVGDEAVMMAIRSECPVVVHPDRVAAANLAIELGATVIVSDDGLQHFRLGRDFEIAVVDGTRQYGNRRLLPAGPLREPLSRLNTIDLILVQDETEMGFGPVHRSSGPPQKDFRLVASAFCSLDDSDIRNCADFSGTTVHAIAGIGNPQRFFRLLEAYDIDVIRHPYPDHADITPGDLEFGDDLDVVMTEKDAVKCRRFNKSNCWYVPVDVAFNDADAVDLLKRILWKISPDDKDKITHG
jgi:tetraacyldisaccharide 4'-kinase